MNILFGWAFARHLKGLHNADYECCHDLLCWLAWNLEKWAWHG